MHPRNNRSQFYTFQVEFEYPVTHPLIKPWTNNDTVIQGIIMLSRDIKNVLLLPYTFNGTVNVTDVRSKDFLGCLVKECENKVRAI